MKIQIEGVAHWVSEIDGHGVTVTMCRRTAAGEGPGVDAGVACMDCEVEYARRRKHHAKDMTVGDLEGYLDRLDADFQIMRDGPWFVSLAGRVGAEPFVAESGSTLAEAMSRALDHFEVRRREAAAGMPEQSGLCLVCGKPGVPRGFSAHGGCASSGGTVGR